MNSTPPDTRPASSDPADIAAWEDRQERIRDERKFREEMRESAGDTRARLAWLADAMEKHARDDAERFADLESRFAPINQSINGTDNKLSYILGGGAAVIALIGFALTVWANLK